MSWPLRPWHLLAAAGAATLWPCLLAGPRAAAGATPWRAALAARQAAPYPRPAPGGAAVPALPQRIVAASVFSAEVALAVVPRTRLAGVIYLAADPRFSADAAALQGLPAVGAEAEQLLAIRPDLVLLDEFTKAETQVLLEGIGVPVVRFGGCSDFAAVTDDIRLLGWVTGGDAAAEALIERMRERLQALARRAADVHAFGVLSLDGALGTCGHGSLLDAALDAAGARNIAAEHGAGAYRLLDTESVLAWRPDALLVAAAPGGEDAVLERLRQDPGLRLLPCVQRRRVVFVSGALLASTSHHALGIAERVQRQLLQWDRP